MGIGLRSSNICISAFRSKLCVSLTNRTNGIQLYTLKTFIYLSNSCSFLASKTTYIAPKPLSILIIQSTCVPKHAEYYHNHDTSSYYETTSNYGSNRKVAITWNAWIWWSLCISGVSLRWSNTVTSVTPEKIQIESSNMTRRCFMIERHIEWYIWHCLWYGLIQGLLLWYRVLPGFDLIVWCKYMENIPIAMNIDAKLIVKNK